MKKVVDEKNFDVSKITEDIIDFYITETTQPDESKRRAKYNILLDIEEKLESAGVFTIPNEEEMDEEDLEDLKEEITEHIFNTVLPKSSVKGKKTAKINVKGVIEEIFNLLTNGGKGEIPLKDGSTLTPDMLTRQFNLNNIDLENLVLVKRKRKKFDPKLADDNLELMERQGFAEQSKAGYSNLLKLIDIIKEEEKKRAREDDGIYFEYIDIPLENIFSNKTMGSLNQRRATYSYWKEVSKKNNQLIEEIDALRDLLLGKNTIEQLKQKIKEEENTQMENIVDFLEVIESFDKQKVYSKDTVNFQEKIFQGTGGNIEIKYNKLNYIIPVKFADVKVDKINKRAGLFVEKFLENQGYLNKLFNVSSAKLLAEEYISGDTGTLDRVLTDISVEDVPETFEAYEKLDEEFDEINLDPLGVVYLFRDLDGLAELYNDNKNTLLAKVSEQFRKYKKVLALDPDDFEELTNKLKQTVTGIKGIRGKEAHLPIFMFRDDPLKRYYKQVGTIAPQIEENINDFLTAYRDLIQDEKTFSAQNIYLALFGLGTGGSPERVRPQERYIKRTSTRVGAKKIRDFSRKIKKQIDTINGLILEVFVKPMHSIHRSGTDLPFQNSTQLRTITVLSEGVGEEYLAYKIMSENLKENDYAFIDETQVIDITSFLKAINRGELFDDPNSKRIRTLAKNFGRAVYRAFDKNKTLKERINKEIASIFGAVQVLSPSDRKIEDYAKYNVKEAFGEERVEDPADIGTLLVLVNALKEKKATLTSQKIREIGRGGLIKETTLDALFSELDRIQKSDIYSRILEAHDSLRILKGQPIYYGKRSENNFDHVEEMLIKMQAEHDLDMSASELVSVVNDIDSFNNISKAHGISQEHVYLIKANFR